MIQSQPFKITSLFAAVDVWVSPSDLDDYQPAGMEALEILHNQLQLLVSDS